ncbi:MAG: hypothetical protein IKG22_00205 [Atopobiaceae bacterium]|nr:hypothetical protein [Atopobiaceae bacterium]
MHWTRLAPLAIALSLTLVACGQPASQTDSTSIEGAQEQPANSSLSTTDTASTAPEQSPSSENESSAAAQTVANPLGTVANTIADDEDALVATYVDRFTQETFEDADTGLAVTYNLFLPADYDASKSYPMVVFIADSSCAKGDPVQSLTQGLGALVWASDEWQSANPTIICVPTYPETILDDHSGYTTTEYVELTKRLIDSVTSTYAVDASRIYGTGQSMGCMTHLILASEYPDLYAACMFVDGQWDVSTLANLEGQSFVYFAAEDDERASQGLSEVRALFDSDEAPYAVAQWDGTWDPNELSTAAGELFGQNQSANFVTWATGTIDAGSGGGMGNASYHMASFDYAYRCIAVMEWLFQQ